MSHKINLRKQRAYSVKKQSGSAIIIAIFVIIVISLLGAGLMSLQRDSAESTSYEVYAVRAYLSAYSASEIGLAQLFPLGSSYAVATNCTDIATTPIEIAVTLPNTIGFHGCTAQYTCAIISGAISTRYNVTGTAVCKNNETNTRRQISVEANSF